MDDALQLALRLVKQNPRDFEARNWVARLEGWKGNYKEAEELYRKTLQDHPRDSEAEFGLADALSWQKQFAAALEVMRGLEHERPDDPEVLIRLGRLSFWQHDRIHSRAYFRQVLKIDPKNQEARAALSAMEMEQPFRLETGYFLEGYDFARNTSAAFAQLVYQDYDRKTFLGRFLYQNKFGENDTLLTLGATYRVLRRTYFRGEVSVAPRSLMVLPNQDYTMELTQGLPHRVAAGAGLRYMRFRGAEVVVPSAIVNWDAKEDLHFYLRYTPAETCFKGSRGRVWNQGVWARLVWDTSRRFSPYALFSTGAESFEVAISSEQLGRFAAHSYGAGIEMRLSPRRGLRVGYFYQPRTPSHQEHWLGASYYFTF